MNEYLAPDRESDRTGPLAVDVRAGAQIRGGGVEVAVAVPAEDVRVTLARALAATIEEENAVAVADEHPRLLLRTRAAGDGDHFRTVARRHKPAFEPKPIARGEGDVLMWCAEIGRRHLRAQRMRDDVGERHREQQREHGERTRCREQEPPAVSPPERVVPPPRPPQRSAAENEQQQARRD